MRDKNKRSEKGGMRNFVQESVQELIEEMEEEYYFLFEDTDSDFDIDNYTFH